MIEEKIRLTQYSHGAGCGCKISPAVLDDILKHAGAKKHFPNLVVGNDERDDAAVVDIGDGIGIVSTTDFFMPIVDDPYDFGRIASVNAISDIYAMGGTPIMAIAILGWPIDKLSPEVANQVIEGGRAVCASLDIPLAGGHSIDSPEPIFGLAVTGRIDLKHLKRNGGASVGSKLYLTKGIGVGILTTAEKKSLLQPAHSTLAKDSMLKINDIGAAVSKLNYVEAITDVTGFGLGGHLSEMCKASNTTAVISLKEVPVIDPVIYDYIAQGSVPGGTNRNFESYGYKISSMTDEEKALICDPQTSGGLLIAVKEGSTTDFESFMKKMGYDVSPIGKMIDKGQHLIHINA